MDKQLGENYLIEFDSSNVDKLDYADIFTQSLFQKYLEILNFSFQKEREYAISQGIYHTGYEHDLDSVKNYIHNPKFSCYILTTSTLAPISFLYVEKNIDDYDKIWTVCTDPDFRNQGMSTKLLRCVIVKQLNRKKIKCYWKFFTMI